MSVMWNLWHGCDKYSEGCVNCYVYRGDARYGRDATVCAKTADFYKPAAKDKNGCYKIQPGTLVFTCFSSDFFLDKADGWRGEAWQMIRSRPDLHFLFITKRILRFYECIPDDWKQGYENVTICCTVENQKRAEERLPFFASLPIKYKEIICEPLLERIDLNGLISDKFYGVTAGGESGNDARICRYSWILALKESCKDTGICFKFKQTGARFEKDGTVYNIPRIKQHEQARRAGIDSFPFQRKFEEYN